MSETTQQEEKKQLVSKNKLLEAGVYFGHKAKEWNPKMKPYIHMKKGNTHIIDIQKTMKTIEFGYSVIKKYVEKGASFIFVGTKQQSKETIKENALRTNSYYVNERWLGGILTNQKTISQRIRRMGDLEKLAETNFEGYTKKEGSLFQKELAKLQKNLLGIRNMRRKPTVMIVANPKHDEIAIREARKVGTKIFGIVDTNVDPTLVDLAIPANDDSKKSISLIITILADAIMEAKGGETLFAYKEDDEIVLPVTPKKPREERYGRNNNFQSREQREPRTPRENKEPKSEETK
ncbi:MAG: 30S ribosomal protein S2 [Mycoplasma sp.]|nr:30S ribosomal protein S2 [Mycoplasma sp.]